MAPPPKQVITRKLVKRFFQNYLPKEPIYAQEEKHKLTECWGKYGIDSAKCKEYEILYDHILEQTEKYRNKLEAMGFKQTVMKTLSRPVYKHEEKGRFRKTAIFKPPSVFDGFR